MPGDILIIDDAYEDIAYLNTILTEAGHKVRAARDGESGLQAARAVMPDLVLLDIILPDQDGFRVCQSFRDDEQLHSVPVVIVSALHDISLKAQAFEAGGFDYITKPFNEHEVIVRVQHQLERVHLREQLQETARITERQHIARELHDSVNQTLFALRATVQAMQMDADALPPAHVTQLDQLNILSKSALAEMRTLLNELRPSQIRKASMQKLLNQLVDAYRLRLEADVRTIIVDCDMPDTVKLVFYRIAQEALNNAAKYARATAISVQFVDEGMVYRLVIEDDGAGFDPSGDHSGMGLHTMRERAEQLGIQFELVSAPGAGTRIEAVWTQTE